jgi:hypothetical protein
MSPKRFLSALCLAAAVLAVSPARADSIEDVAKVLDKIDSVVPKGAPDGLPFNGNDLRKYGDLIKHCEYASGADNIVACVDDWSSSEAGQQADIPSWFPQMLDIYLDISDKDYWGLLEDGGEAVACATGTILTGGVDVCGAIKELVDAAKATLAAAEAVGQFLSDLGGTIADIGSEVYCWFSDCGDAPPKMSDADKAYQYFYLPRVPHGLELRLAGGNAWVLYSGEGETFTPQVVSEGLAAAGGFTLGGLTQALPKFIAAVNAQWDAKMLAQAQAVQKEAHNWGDARAQQYAANIADGATSLVGFKVFNYWKSAVAERKTQAHDDCVDALAAAGGAKVDAWVTAGGPVRIKAAPGFPWAGTYPALCNLFDAQLKALLQPYLFDAYTQYFNSSVSGCSKDGEIYTCVNKGVAQDCKAWMQMQGKATMNCQWGGPGKGVFNCKGVYKLLQLPPPPGGYPGCTRQGIGNAPPPGSSPDPTL